MRQDGQPKPIRQFSNGHHTGIYLGRSRDRPSKIGEPQPLPRDRNRSSPPLPSPRNWCSAVALSLALELRLPWAPRTGRSTRGLARRGPRASVAEIAAPSPVVVLFLTQNDVVSFAACRRSATPEGIRGTGGGNMTLRDKLIWAAVCRGRSDRFPASSPFRGESRSTPRGWSSPRSASTLSLSLYALFIPAGLSRRPDARDAGLSHNAASTTCRETVTCCSGTISPHRRRRGRWLGGLAAQMGYLRLSFRVVFAGAVQDMTVLFFSTRRRPVAGRHGAHRAGAIAGAIAGVGVLLICVISSGARPCRRQALVAAPGARSTGGLHPAIALLRASMRA